MKHYTLKWAMNEQLAASTAKPCPFPGDWPTRVGIVCLFKSKSPFKDWFYLGKPSRHIYWEWQRRFLRQRNMSIWSVVEFDRRSVFNRVSWGCEHGQAASTCENLLRFYTPGLRGGSVDPLDWMRLALERVKIAPGYYIYSVTPEALWKEQSLEILGVTPKSKPMHPEPAPTPSTYTNFIGGENVAFTTQPQIGRTIRYVNMDGEIVEIAEPDWTP